MKQNKTFTLSEFLNIKEVDLINEIDIGKPFFLLAEHKMQKIMWKAMIESNPDNNITNLLNNPKMDTSIEYWIKAKDGCVQTKKSRIVADPANVITTSDDLTIKI